MRVPVVVAASATAICTRSSGWPLLEAWALEKVLLTEPSLTLRFVGCGIVAAGCVGPASAAGEAAVAAGVSVVSVAGVVVGLVSGTSSVFGARFVVARSVVAFWRGVVVAAGASSPLGAASSSGMTSVFGACCVRVGAGSVTTGAAARVAGASATSAAPEEEKTLPGQELKGMAPLAAYPPAMTEAARHEPAATEARRERRGAPACPSCRRPAVGP